MTSGLANTARHQLRIASEFLEHLQCHGRTLKSCAQADLDLWFAHDHGTRQGSRVFLRWCIRQREMPRLRLPPALAPEKKALSQQQRLLYLRHVLTADTMPAVDRVLALLVLLFAQPLHRIARLTLDDLIYDGDQLLLCLGEPSTPFPAPFAEILTAYLGTRLISAANQNSRFLFPGRHAGQPMHTTSLRLRLRNAGLPNEAARIAALRELAIQAPPAVVATMFGYHPNTAELLAAEAGTTWQRYAAGDHSRPS